MAAFEAEIAWTVVEIGLNDGAANFYCKQQQTELGSGMEISVGPIGEEQIDKAGQLLARAFEHDPLQQYIFPDLEERRRLSGAQFATLVRDGSMFGEVVLAGNGAGVSVWSRPGEPATAQRAEAAGYTILPDNMGHEAFARLGGVLDYLSEAHEPGLPTMRWYLMIVGVEPTRRRQGVGAAVLDPIIRRADEAELPICLDTAAADVQPFYESLGFKVAISTIDPVSGLRFWTYQRDPNA